MLEPWSALLKKICHVGISVFLLIGCTANEKEDMAIHTLDILKVNLGEAFEKKVLDTTVELHYCPDNTCLIFSSTKDHEEELADFSLLYLSYISSYVYLFKDMHGNGVFIENAKNAAATILLKYKKECTGNKLYIISCSINNLYTNKKEWISVYGNRYDEGQTSTFDINVDEKLSKESLIKVEARRKKLMGLD